MKRLIFLASLITLFIVGSGVWFLVSLAPVNSDKTLKRFVIDQGETANQIGMDLAKANIIKNALAFRIYSQVTQSARNIKPGSYELGENQWVPQIISKLLAGPTEVWVTIPEGFRREEIVAKFVAEFGLTGKSADSFTQTFLNLTKNKEGYLFPDTYLMPKDSSPADVVKIMGATFNSKVNFSVNNDTVILASILERETRTDEERPVVAGILLKRISAGWPLQADATIQYALGNWNPIGASDINIDSPYNTYKNTGLPPTPICNPGISSLKAAANPVTSNYWYYIHDKTGQIHYAETIDEQNANIAKYL